MGSKIFRNDLSGNKQALVKSKGINDKGNTSLNSRAKAVCALAHLHTKLTDITTNNKFHSQFQDLMSALFTVHLQAPLTHCCKERCYGISHMKAVKMIGQLAVEGCNTHTHTHTHTHTFVSITFEDITLTYIHSL